MQDFNNKFIMTKCANFNLPQYPKLDAYLKDKLGDGSIDYTSIKNNYLNDDDYEYFYDDIAQVPYILSKDKTLFISYDDPRSILAKCEYVKNNDCAGVMYWENGCDSTGDLVNAIYDGLKKDN